jgi:hypothetical protein
LRVRLVGSWLCRVTPLLGYLQQERAKAKSAHHQMLRVSQRHGNGVFTRKASGQHRIASLLLLYGLDSNNIASGNTVNLLVPATDSLQEFIVQTSLYHASHVTQCG